MVKLAPFFLLRLVQLPFPRADRPRFRAPRVDRHDARFEVGEDQVRYLRDGSRRVMETVLFAIGTLVFLPAGLLIFIPGVVEPVVAIAALVLGLALLARTVVSHYHVERVQVRLSGLVAQRGLRGRLSEGAYPAAEAREVVLVYDLVLTSWATWKRYAGRPDRSALLFGAEAARQDRERRIRMARLLVPMGAWRLGVRMADGTVVGVATDVDERRARRAAQRVSGLLAEGAGHVVPVVEVGPLAGWRPDRMPDLRPTQGPVEAAVSPAQAPTPAPSTMAAGAPGAPATVVLARRPGRSAGPAPEGPDQEEA